MLLIGPRGLIDCNPAAVASLRYGGKAEVLARDLAGLSPEFQPDGRRSDERAKELSATAFAEGSLRFGWMLRRADGEPIPSEFTLTAVDADGGPALVALWGDADGREGAGRAVTSDASYREIFDLSNEAIYVHDKDDGRIVDVNKKACEIHGYGLDEFKQLGMSAMMTEPPYSEADAAPFLRNAIAGEPQLFEWLSKDRSGRRFWMEVSLKRAAIGGQDRILSTARDITERKQAEAALRRAHEELQRAHEGLERRVSERTAELAAANSALQRAKEEAERANRAKSEFLSRMSHELRTPMNSILGFSQVLARKQLPADQRKSVEHIERAGRHLLNLINEVLDISRIEAGRMQLSSEPVSVGHVVQEAITLTQPLAAQRGCEVRDEVGPRRDYYVMADRQRLIQVLLNLVSNALKYNSEQSAVRVSCAERGGGVLRLSVSDDGVGISPEKLGRLFNPFERLGAEQTGVEGTGLGLALSKGLYRAFVRDSREIAEGVVVGQAGWGQRLEENRRAFVEAWVARAEFKAKYDPMTNEQYVDALFQNAGVTPTAQEKKALVDGLDSSSATRAEILWQVADSGSFREAERNRAFVLMQYFAYLRRDPNAAPDVDYSGWQYWLAKLDYYDGDFVRAEMVRAFLVSNEFRQRFGQ